MMLRAWHISGLLLLATQVGVVGCASTPQTRGQIQDDAPEADRYEVKTVANVTEMVGNANGYMVAGVGLVTGLNGTGSAALPSGWRSRLERDLQRRGIPQDKVKALLTDKDNSLVLVAGMIPAGSHRGEKFDIQVSLPPNSTTTSLRGGYLVECTLVDPAMIASLGPQSSTDRPGLGIPQAKAGGQLLVDMALNHEGPATKARVWSGGRSLKELTFQISMNQQNQSARLVAQVAERINESFQTDSQGFGGGTIATPGEDRVSVAIGVPPQYHLNLPRFLRVIRLVPLLERKKIDKDDTLNNPNRVPEMMAHYKQQLAEDLLDPARTVTAALRLEALGKNTALGKESIQALGRGLVNEHVLVRFCSAEALAYLGYPKSGEELARIVVEQPYLRAYALTALASMDDGISIAALEDLLLQPDPEVRYGAFRALRTLNEQDPAVNGEELNHAFWLHEVAPGSSPLVHVCTSHRAEVVVFGRDVALNPGFSLLAGNFVVASAGVDTRCTISHRVGGEREYKQCSLKVDDVLRTMAAMGAQYNEVLELLTQAYRIKSLTCELRIDALPQAPSVEELSRAGLDAHRSAELARKGLRNDMQDRTDEELFNVRDQLSSTPGLFAQSTFGGKASLEVLRDQEAALGDSRTQPQQRVSQNGQDGSR
jgi:hypothetical protein